MSGQSWDPERYQRNAGFVAELGLPVVEWLAPKPGERILDLGCGDGALTLKLAALGCDVVGVDASAEQIEAARARGLDARIVDGAGLAFEAEFDAVFSNAALHWMLDPAAVIAGVRRSLKPGGRFVGEFGGGANVRRLHEALIAALDRRGLDGRAASPWFFPSVGQYRALLLQAFYSIRSERQLMEQLDYNLLFRWFVG
ncbi:Transposase domain, partial [Tistlia consotensis]